MKFTKDLYDELVEINGLIEKEDILNATIKFKEYLKKVIVLGRFEPTIWNIRWRDEVYEFGLKFKKRDPVEFLKIIHEEKKELHKDNQEVLDFFKSEIEINNQPHSDSIRIIIDLIKKYPYNPEFRHDLGHLLLRKGNILNAIEQYRFAIERDPNNKTFTKRLFNTQSLHIENLINNNEYQKALDYCKEIQRNEIYRTNYVYNNILISYKQRINDYIVFENKIQVANKNFKELVKEETNNERKRLIEILGFFSAIIAFIFSTVSVSLNFNYQESLSFIVCLGLSLLIFLVTLNILFSGERIRYSHPKFLILIILILTLILTFSKLIIINH